MHTSEVVAISELRTHWQKVLTSLAKGGSKYVFVNNKPKAVLMSCKEYEYLKQIAEIYRLQAESDYAVAYGPKFSSGEKMIASLLED